MAQFNSSTPEQHKDIQEFARGGMRSSDSLRDQYLAGVEQAGQGLMDQQNPIAFSSENRAMYSALEKRSRGDFDQALKRLKIQAGVDAVNDRFSRLTQAASLTAAEIQHNHEVKMAKKALKENRRRARAGVIGNVLGIAGAIGGGVAAGSVSGGLKAPEGAFLGYQAGQGAGQAIGGGF